MIIGELSLSRIRDIKVQASPTEINVSAETGLPKFNNEPSMDLTINFKNDGSLMLTTLSLENAINLHQALKIGIATMQKTRVKLIPDAPLFFMEAEVNGNAER